jgi:hypothetical protein
MGSRNIPLPQLPASYSNSWKRLSPRGYPTNSLTPPKSQSYVATDGQSVSLSWCQAPIWGPRQNFYYCQTVAGLLMWGALSNERTGLSFAIAVRIHSQVRFPRDSWPHFIVLDLRLPQPGGPDPRIYIPRNRVAQLYPQALGSLFVASYDSQG